MTIYRLRMQFFTKALTYLFCVFLANAALASDIGEHMDNFWDDLGRGVNVTAPQFLETQRAGHMSLGSFYMRNRVSNEQLASITAPSISAGCGGIDFHSGGMSFLSAEDFLNTIKNVMANAQGLLFQMAIDTVTPKLSTHIKYFHNFQQKINNLNINSCETARNLIDGAFGKLDGLRAQGCKMSGIFSNYAQDAAGAFEACTSGNEFGSVMSSAPDNIKDKFNPSEKNLAWHALKESGFIGSGSNFDKELAELLITLSGTVIFTYPGGEGNSEAAPKADFYNAKMTESSFLKAVLTGGTVTTHNCPDAECMNMQKNANSVNIAASESFVNKVEAELIDIADKIKNDDGSTLDSNNYKLFKYTALPIFRMLAIHSNYYATGTINIGNIGGYVALDVLYGYLDEVNELIRRSARIYKGKLDEELFKDFFAEQEKIRQFIFQERRKLSNQLDDYISLMERTEMVEKLLKQKVSRSATMNAFRF